ncbi:MAG TPA: biopolymer transporter ExbD [Atribacteraceae bacterium]|nr:biopolymer transporter ExbD [Atribacteraceae bacterium]
MTPLVDVVLQLVIFFLVTTTFVSVQTGAQVNLPSADFSRIEEAQTITVSITENNMIYVDGALIDAVELPSLVVVSLRNDPLATVVVEADRNVLHGKVISVMDILKKAGAEKLAVATQPTTSE